MERERELSLFFFQRSRFFFSLSFFLFSLFFFLAFASLGNTQ